MPPKTKSLPMPTRPQPTSSSAPEITASSTTTSTRTSRLPPPPPPAASSSASTSRNTNPVPSPSSSSSSSSSSLPFAKVAASPSSEKFTPSNIILLPSKLIEELRLVVGSLVEVSKFDGNNNNINNPKNIILAVMRDTEQDRLRKPASSGSPSIQLVRLAASTLVHLLPDHDDDNEDVSSNSSFLLVKPYTRCDVDDLVEVVIRQRILDEDDENNNNNNKSTRAADLVEELQMFERSMPRDSGVASIIFEGMVVQCSSGTRMLDIEVVSVKFEGNVMNKNTTTGYFTGHTKIVSERQLQQEQSSEKQEQQESKITSSSFLNFIVGDHGSGKTTKMKKIQKQQQQQQQLNNSSSSKWISGGGIAALPSAKDKVQFLKSLIVGDVSSSSSVVFFDDIHLFLHSDEIIIPVFAKVLQHLVDASVHVYCSVLSGNNNNSSTSSSLRIEDILPRELLVISSCGISPQVEYLSLPSTEERIEILQSLLAINNNQSSSSSSSSFISNDAIVDIASTAYGYSPLDFKVLIDVARSYEYANNTKPERTDDRDEAAASDASVAAVAVQITEKNLRRARRAVQPASLKSISAVSPPSSTTWNDIGGSDEAKTALQECLAFANEKAQKQFAKFGVSAPRGVLLYGPPGCSKTLLAKALSSEGKLNFISVKGSEIYSKWVGDSEKAVRDIFDRARAAAPCVIFVDELDGMCGKRGGGGVGDRVISQLLVELDGLPKNSGSGSGNSAASGIIFVAATNRPDVIDEAVLRPGRIDRKVYVGLPCASDRAAIVKIALKGIPVSDEIGKSQYLSTELVARTEGYTGAEMVSLCKRAAALAVYEDGAADCVERRHFEQALKEVKPRIQKKDIEWYLNWGNMKSTATK